MTNRLFPALLALLLLLPLSGCRDQRILERLGVIQSTSYDLAEGGKMKVVVAVPKSDPESQEKREVLTTVASSGKDARIQLSRESDLILVSGQLRNTLFGTSIARQGIWDHVDTLVRDPAISPQVKVTVVNGNAGDMLSKEFKQHPRTGKYIDRLLEKEALGNTIPRVTLMTFVRDYWDDGIDPVAPIVKDEGKSVSTDGIALFRDDRYVAKISSKDSLIFAFLTGDIRKGEISIEQTGERGKELIMLTSMISSRNVRASRNGKEVHFSVSAKGSVLEYIGELKLSDEGDRHVLERRVEQYFNERAQAMVRMMQRNRIDNLGVGTYVRNAVGYGAWKRMNWREDFAGVKVKVSFRFVISNYGKFR